MGDNSLEHDSYEEYLKNYKGEHAEETIEEEELEERKEALKAGVEEQRERVKAANNAVEDLEQFLGRLKEAKRVEENSLDELRDTAVGDFEDIGEVELSRDGDDTETIDGLEGENPFRSSVSSRFGTEKTKTVTL